MNIEKRIKKIVLEREGYECRICQSTEKLHVHHIKPKGRKGKDCIENLITLCNKHHFKVHTTLTYGIWINRLRQLILLKKPKMSLIPFIK